MLGPRTTLSPPNAPPPQHPAPRTLAPTFLALLTTPLPPLTFEGFQYYQFGMAPGAFLSSAAIATHWVGTTGEFEISTATFVYGYKTVMQDGVERPLAPGISFTRPVDVVNSSWGYGDPAG